MTRPDEDGRNDGDDILLRMKGRYRRAPWLLSMCLTSCMVDFLCPSFPGIVFLYARNSGVLGKAAVCSYTNMSRAY